MVLATFIANYLHLFLDEYLECQLGMTLLLTPLLLN